MSVGLRVVTSKSAGVGARVGEGFGMAWLLFCGARVVARGGWASGPQLGERSAGSVRRMSGGSGAVQAAVGDLVGARAPGRRRVALAEGQRAQGEQSRRGGDGD